MRIYDERLIDIVYIWMGIGMISLLTIGLIIRAIWKQFKEKLKANTERIEKGEQHFTYPFVSTLELIILTKFLLTYIIIEFWFLTLLGPIEKVRKLSTDKKPDNYESDHNLWLDVTEKKGERMGKVED